MRRSHKTASFVAALGLAAAGLVATTPADALPVKKACSRTNDTLQKLLECVTLAGAMRHQEAFQAIADAHDGTRASGTSGYDASAEYVADRMRAAGYQVTIQTFDFYLFEEVGPSALQQVAPNQVTYVENTDFVATPHSVPGDVTASVTPVDLDLGLGNTSTSGCEPADFTGFPAGNIALIQRGFCTFEQKAENAAAAGAVGVLFFNQGDTTAAARQGLPAVTLGNGYTGGIPALSATYALGEQLAATSGLRMRLFANVSRELSETSNVLAESTTGDPSNVVMAGAHLDSVPEGPGINDNGSGSSALLTVAEQMAKSPIANRLRFAWWGAEEGGLVGSTHYVTSLTAAQRATIEMYLNFDMVASPNYGLFIYDGDGSGFGLTGPDGSDEIEWLFERYYKEVRDVPSEPTPFSGRSDYQAFINNGIPSGGLFTGAEAPKTADQAAKWGGTAGIAFDPCYHSVCDTIDNLSHEALEINADAIAYVLYLFATGGEVLND